MVARDQLVFGAYIRIGGQLLRIVDLFDDGDSPHVALEDCATLKRDWHPTPRVLRTGELVVAADGGEL